MLFGSLAYHGTGFLRNTLCLLCVSYNQPSVVFVKDPPTTRVLHNNIYAKQIYSPILLLACLPVGVSLFVMCAVLPAFYTVVLLTGPPTLCVV